MSRPGRIGAARRPGGDCGRLVRSIKLDDRRGRTGRLECKVKSVEQKLGRPLSTL